LPSLEALNGVGEFDRGTSKFSRDRLDAEVRELMRRQFGNVSRRQLLALGYSSGRVQARLRNGTLVKRHDGVYCQAPARQDPQALIAAAVVAGGPTAVASHASAAFLWGFVPHWEHPPEIALPTGDRRPRHILTHRCPSLQPRDITRQRGVPTTSPARTVLDLAPRLSNKTLTRLVNDTLRSRLLRPAALRDVLDRNRHHPATRLLTPFAENPGNPTRSAFEDDFLAFIEKYNLPAPQINVYVNGREVDAYFPDHNVIVECDGWEYHKDPEAFEADRERDTANLDHGLSTVRITKKRLTNTPDDEAARLRRILTRGARRR
jgi:hypothetical protein